MNDTKYISKRLMSAATMPRLKHKVGERYKAGDSQVLDWIAGRLDLVEWTMMNLANRGLIVYDESSGEWRGVNCDGETVTLLPWDDRPGSPIPRKRPTRYKRTDYKGYPKYSIETIVRSIKAAGEPDGTVHWEVLRNWCQEMEGMSKASFFRWLKLSQESGEVVRAGRGIYAVATTSPAPENQIPKA